VKFDLRAFLAAAGMVALLCAPANALDPGKGGVYIGVSAGVPPPGIYMFDQVFTYDANFVGPVVKTKTGPSPTTGVQSADDVQGFVFVPGWTLLGATYSAVVLQPFEMRSVGSPFNTQYAGGGRTHVTPAELSWKLGNSGFFVKAGLGFDTPDGAATGPYGISNAGARYWTVQPALIFSYLKDSWALSVALYEQFNIRNSATPYTSGNRFHADFTVTRSFGKWTLGPVAYYYGQVTSPTCSAACLTASLATVQDYNVWAVGGLIGYDFGVANLSVWATQDVSVRADNPLAPSATGSPVAFVAKGLTVFATLSYRLWGPDEPAAMPVKAPRKPGQS